MINAKNTSFPNLSKTIMTLSLRQVAASIVEVCRDGDVFSPSMLRKALQKDFIETEASHLSSKIQPHLRTLKLSGVISSIPTYQQRNKPYQIIDRALLIEISNNENCYYPNKFGVVIATKRSKDVELINEKYEAPEDEKNNSIIEINRRRSVSR